MENPATWGRAEHVVSEALAQSDKNKLERRMGFSTTRLITDALRREGLLHEDGGDEELLPVQHASRDDHHDRMD